jgi:hypothetical protein
MQRRREDRHADDGPSARLYKPADACHRYLKIQQMFEYLLTNDHIIGCVRQFRITFGQVSIKNAAIKARVELVFLAYVRCVDIYGPKIWPDAEVHSGRTLPATYIEDSQPLSR